MAASDLYPEPVRILSDLHFGHPGCRVESVEQLRPLLEGAGTVILNGDTLEMRAASFRPEAERFYGELRALAEALGVRLELLTGNHDPAITDRHHIDLCGGEVLVTHGDVLYPEIAPWSVNGREKLRRILDYDRQLREEHGDGFEERLDRAKKVCEFTTVFEPRVKRGSIGSLRTLLTLVWPPWRWLVVVGIWLRQADRAVSFCEEYRPEAKCILFGHTHHAGVGKARGRIAVNTGGFVSLGRTLLAEVEGGELRAYRVRRRRDGFFARDREPRFRARFGKAGPARDPECVDKLAD